MNPMLGQYTIESIANNQYLLNFEIPDNCYYQISNTGPKFTIGIFLNSGQTTPSTNMVMQTETLNTGSKNLTLNFEQNYSATTIIKKPSITIEA